MNPGTHRTMAFWPFAEDLYSQSGVADHCLWLQDHCEVDVVMLLFCLWAGKYRGALSREHLEQLLAETERWSAHLIRPLRGARRWLKAEAEQGSGLYQQLKTVELAAEQQLIERLEAALEASATDNTPGGGAAGANLEDYLVLADIRLPSEGQRRARALVDRAMAI